jgi:hypothetical protein
VPNAERVGAGITTTIYQPPEQLRNGGDIVAHMSAPVEKIVLAKPRWEALARDIGTGVDGPKAYGDLFECALSNRARQYNRLVKNHPEILKRAEQIRVEVHSATIRRASMTRGDVQDAVLRNIEAAQSIGKPIVAKGEIVGWYPDYAAINQGLKIAADLNGLTIAMKAKEARGDSDPDVLMTPEHLVGSILRKYAAANGRGMADGAVAGLHALAASARSGSGTGQVHEEPIEVLSPVPETEGVP